MDKQVKREETKEGEGGEEKGGTYKERARKEGQRGRERGRIENGERQSESEQCQ